jgi:hypothetical protein
MKDRRTAFAVGGLAGNNAHGAGFLQAAIDQAVKPEMISCTSGQILWVYRYLTAARSGLPGSLRAMLEADLESLRVTGEPNIDLALLGLLGKEGVFRPSCELFFADWLRNATAVWGDAIAGNSKALLAKQCLSVVPCRVLVPQFAPAFFADIAQAFEHAEVGIAFNSYNPCSGEEYVYLNPPARKLLTHSGRSKSAYAPGQRSEHKPYRTYQAIDADAVRDALWLYQYGFDQKTSHFVDGAYFRGMMLAEVARADVIYAVRPIDHQWRASLPTNYLEMEDLKTEVGFNGTYSAERNQILLVNKLVKDGALAGPPEGKYHHVDLEELQIETERGYFDYLFESLDVFDRAHDQAVKRFAQRHRGPSAAP